jgi:hypothetical protein
MVTFFFTSMKEILFENLDIERAILIEELENNIH